MNTLWLKEKVFAEIKNEAENCHPNENGGILWGYGYFERKISVVTNLIKAGPRAQNLEHRFLADNQFQIGEIKRLYKQDKRFSYIGNWHSHPDGTPLLSWLDKKALKKISNYYPARLAHPISLILYGNPDGWELMVYQLFKEKKWWGTRHIYQPLEVKFFD